MKQYILYERYDISHRQPCKQNLFHYYFNLLKFTVVLLTPIPTKFPEFEFDSRFQTVTSQIYSPTRYTSFEDKKALNREIIELLEDFLQAAMLYGRLILSERFFIQNGTIRSSLTNNDTILVKQLLVVY